MASMWETTDPDFWPSARKAAAARRRMRPAARAVGAGTRSTNRVSDRWWDLRADAYVGRSGE